MINPVSEEELAMLFAKGDDSLLMASDRIADTLKLLYQELRKPVASKWFDIDAEDAIRYIDGRPLASIEGPNGWYILGMMGEGVDILHQGIEMGVEGKIAADTYLLSKGYRLMGGSMALVEKQ